MIVAENLESVGIAWILSQKHDDGGEERTV